MTSGEVAIVIAGTRDWARRREGPLTPREVHPGNRRVVDALIVWITPNGQLRISVSSTSSSSVARNTAVPPVSPAARVIAEGVRV